MPKTYNKCIKKIINYVLLIIFCNILQTNTFISSTYLFITDTYEFILENRNKIEYQILYLNSVIHESNFVFDKLCAGVLCIKQFLQLNSSLNHHYTIISFVRNKSTIQRSCMIVLQRESQCVS